MLELWIDVSGFSCTQRQQLSDMFLYIAMDNLPQQAFRGTSDVMSRILYIFWCWKGLFVL